MDVNADFSRRALVHGARLPWQASPMAGVERRMLDRVGDEVARATSIVRYAAGSRFSPHVHGGGEEILVLDGVFSDEHGDFPAGFYLRNPPQSRHAPSSGPGCVIFVKLWQFDPEDRAVVRIDMRNSAFEPAADGTGIERLDLFRRGREQVWLERWPAHAWVERSAAGGLEIFVLEGSCVLGDIELRAQGWLREPGGTVTLRAGTEGCRVWLKRGCVPGSV